MFLKNNNISNKEPSGTASPVGGKKPGAPTVIANDISILGNVISEGTVDMDGRVDGTIKAPQITIRPGGVVKGDLTGDVIHVYGEVKGIIKAKNVVLFSSCRVEGVIMHESLTIEDGAFVDGKFKRSDKISAANDDDDTSTEFTDSAISEPDARSANPSGIKILDNLKLVSG
jgi:cytoskeletal protein CcmA (bactofilin family)